MSRASKLVLGLSVALTVGTVAGVHLKQAWDRQRLHDGVVRDLERWERKKENLRRLEEQRLLTRHLREERQRREEAQLHLPAGEEEEQQEVQRH